MTRSTICPSGWKEATTYHGDGGWRTVYYDPQRPCARCGFPVMQVSAVHPDLCVWCDAGELRPEQGCAYIEALHAFLREHGLWDAFRRGGGW
jgi:hypothetical protein